MHKRKISTRAGAWILSAAMLVNGVPVNVFAEDTADGFYSGSVSEDSGGMDAGESTGAGGEDTSGGSDSLGQGENGSGTQDSTDSQGSEVSSGDSEDASGFTDSDSMDQQNENGANESGEITEITSHDAIFQVLWSDEDDLADRRDDEDLSKRFTIYQNGQPMESQPQIVLDKEMEDGTGGTRLGTYRVQSLPDSDGSGTEYTYSIRENVPAGYEAFTADAVTDLDDEATSALLAQLIAPDQELPVTLAEGDNLYRADKMFGNYLRQYTFEGSITWNDNANQQNIRPDLESWFQNHIQVTLDGAAYKSFRVHYEQNADDESVWNYQIKGLFAVKEDKTQAAYEVSLDAPEGYVTENGTFTVNGNQKDCQTVFELVQDDNGAAAEPETTPDATGTPDAEKPTEAPEETPNIEPTEAPEETPNAEPTEAPEEISEAENSDAEDFISDDSSEELETFTAAPQEISTYAINGTVKKSEGSASIAIAFLDESAKTKEGYYKLISEQGVLLTYNDGTAEQEIALVYDANNNKWTAKDPAKVPAWLNQSLESYINNNKLDSTNWTLGTGTIELSGLPSKIGTSDDENSWTTVNWGLKLNTEKTGKDNQLPGYYPVQNHDGVWSYIPYYKYTNGGTGGGFNITIDLREGDKKLFKSEEEFAKLSEEAKNTLLNALCDNLQLTYVFNGTTENVDFTALKNTFSDVNVKPVYNEETDTITLNIRNLPWCNLDKEEYTYSVSTKETSEGTDSISDRNLVTDGDLLVPRYDNADSPNFSSVTDRCHDNGKMYLTLKGTTSYSANKIWLDDNSAKDDRPDVTWKLWRYPQKPGVDYTKASPVILTGKKQVEQSIDKGMDAEISKEYTFSDLPKYDVDGYLYIYLVRETGNMGNYQQVFGCVDKNGNITKNSDYLPEGVTRDSENTSLYNGGTLSNRITGTTNTAVRKEWINAAHQDSIQNVTVKLTLQKSSNGTDWMDVDGYKDIEMSGFRSEIQEKELSASVAQYDEWGKTLQYRWVESGITEKESETAENTAKVKEDNGVIKSFTLNCNDDTDGEEYYKSEISTDQDGNTVISNRLVGVTDYFIDKLWDMEGASEDKKTAPDAYENTTITVALYQDGKFYKNYTVSKDPSVTKDSEWTSEGPNAENTDSKERTNDRKWSNLITNLPKYSEDGHKYSYYAVEVNDENQVVAMYSYNKEELNSYSVNNAQITNSKGERGSYIRVEKVWEDDGDRDNRLPVYLGVWRKARNADDSDKYLGQVKLTEDNNWWQYFILPNDCQSGDSYYIREIGMGNGSVTFAAQTNSTNTADTENKKGNPLIQNNEISVPVVSGEKDNLVAAGGDVEPDKVVDYVDTDEYRYDVRYTCIKAGSSISSENQAAVSFPVDTYRVINHRYGWINLDIEKVWNDGNEKKAKDRKALNAEVRLEIANPNEVSDVKISDDGSCIISNGIQYPIYSDTQLTQPGNKNQKLGNTKDGGENSNTEVVHFYNLPKFDKNGAKIHYRVTEYAPKAENGNLTTLEKAEYVSSISYGDYTVVKNKKHALDTQEITITNTRTRTKDATFYKLWVDQANKDNRPDIYFTLYQSVDGQAPTRYGRFKPYEVSETADEAYITYAFRNLPKYDSKGAEITYYAAEDMHADGSALDYIPVQYYYAENGKADADSDGLDNGLKKTYLTDKNAVSYSSVGYDTTAEKYTVTTQADASGNKRVLLAAKAKASDPDVFLLKEGGTFVNELRSAAKIAGKKVWKNVLADFPKNQLPELNFDLKQSVLDAAGNEIAGTEKTVSTFADNLSTKADQTEFSFMMKYLGRNDINGNYISSYSDANTKAETDQQWKELLPKYDENGRLYKYSLEEKFVNAQDHASELYKVTYATHTYLVNNTYKEGTAKLTISKNWEKNREGKNPNVTFRLYRFFANGKDEKQNPVYTTPKIVQTKVLENGQSQVTFDKLNIYAPNGSKCYYFVEEIVPNGYSCSEFHMDFGTAANPAGIEAAQISNISKSGSTSEIFTFKDANLQNDGNYPEVTGSGSVKNTYDNPGTVVLKGNKVWDDINNDFNTRPDTIQIQVYRRANAQGTNNAIPANGENWENILVGNDTEITIGTQAGDISFSPNTDTTTTGIKTLNTKTIMVSCSASDSNKWTYTISGLDQYAPNGNTWIYKVVETPVTITDNNTGAEIKYDGGNGESNQKIVSSSEITMTDLTNKLETTSLTVQKKWENQHGIVAGLASVTVDLWVKVGNSSYVKASDYIAGAKNGDTNAAYFAKALAEQKIQLSQTITGNGSCTFKGLPKVLKTTDGIQICQYVAVESVITYKSLDTDNKYKDNTVTLIPTSIEANDTTINVTYDHSNIDTLIYTIGYVRDADTGKIIITNVLSDPHRTSISIQKVWDNDSDNKFKTRPTHIRIELYRAEVPENGGDEQYKPLPSRLYWSLALDKGKISKNQIVDHWSIDDKGVATLYGLPAKSPDGTKTYKYKVVEIGDSNMANSILEIVGKDTSTPAKDIAVGTLKNENRKPGYYEINYGTGAGTVSDPEVITNSLATVDLTVTKAWSGDADGNIHNFRPETVSLTLWRCERKSDGTPKYSSAEDITKLYGNAPTWTDNQDNTWTCTYANLPKYYGVTASGGAYQGNEYYYYVKEANQPGYLDGVITEHSRGGASTQTVTLTNTATVFQINKTDVAGNSIWNRDLEFTLTGKRTDNVTKDYRAIWSRKKIGDDFIEAVSVQKYNNKTGNWDTIYSESASQAETSVSIKGLPVGTYQLEETDVPEGYKKANLENVTVTLSSTPGSGKNIAPDTAQRLAVTVTQSDTVTVVTPTAEGTTTAISVLTVADTKTGLDVIKTDGKKKLSGAKFVLKPAEGSHFASRDNDKNGFEFTVGENGIDNNPTTGELIIGNTYILTENEAPEGYIRPDLSTGDKPTVTFTLDDNGNIISSDTITGFAFADVSITKDNSECFTIVNHPIEITLQKSSSRTDMVGLAGAKFTLTDNTVKATSSEEASYKKEIITKGNGQLKLSGTDEDVKLIQNHSYTLKETQAPDGYILPDNHPTVSFTVDENGTIKNVTTSPEGYITVSTTGETANKLIKVKNDPVEFSLEKQDVVKNADQSERYLADAVFELYKGDKADQTVTYGDKPITVLKTDGNGRLTFTTSTEKDGYKLTTGVRYKLVETKAPVGYEKASAFTFVINTNGTITYETGSGNNAEETLYNEANKTFTVKDVKTSFELDKINSEKKSAINDGELELTVKDEAKNTVFIWRRNSEGIVSVEASNSYASTIEYRDGKIYGLPVSIAGTATEYYVLSETRTPKGYATAASVEFTMGVDGKLSYYENNADVENNNKLELITGETNESKLTIFDQPIRGHVTITKTLEGTTKTLKGVTFDLYKKKNTGTSAAGATSENEILIASGLITDINGQWTTQNNSNCFAETAGEGSNAPLSKGLPSGTYYFKERSTTDDAVLASDPVGEFTVTDTSMNAIVTVDPVNITNAEFNASLKLKKVDATTNAVITKGVTFKLQKYTLENNVVSTEDIAETSVDANGEIVFNNLKKGKYILSEIAATGYEGGFIAYFEIVENDNGQTIEVKQANTNRFFSDVMLSKPLASSWLSEFGIYNTRKKAALTVYKVGLESPTQGAVGGIGLNGVEFSLYKKAENAAQANGYTEVLQGLTTGWKYSYEKRDVAYTPSATGQTSDGTLKITDLEWGTYKLVETKSADGYSVTEDATGKTVSVEFTVNQFSDFEKGIKLEITGENEIHNYQTKLRVEKKNAGGTPLAGAVFEISGVFAGNTETATKKAVTNTSGELVLEENKDAGITGITGLLVAGKTYTLKEITPPAGYELLSGTISFVMNPDGKIAKVVNEGEKEEAWPAGYILSSADFFDNLITVTDNKIQIHLEKYDADNPDERLTGAEFTVTPVNGATFANRTTQSITLTDANMLNGLDGMVIAGNSYKVTETKAPDGYKLAAEFIFTVKDDGSVEITDPDSHSFVTTDSENGIAVIKITDSKNKLVITKTNENSTPLIPTVMNQVQLTITDITNVSEGNTGKVVMNLTSTPSANDPYTYDSANASWTIEGQLIQGHTYRLDETGVPDNYLIAAPVEFTMGTNGSITIESGAVEESQAGQISDQDKRANNLYLTGEQNNTLKIRDTEVKASVTITKTVTGVNTGIPNVEFEFYRQKADGTPELIQNETTNPASRTWTTGSDGTLTVNGLSVGNYYFKEVKADGYAYDTNKVYRVSVSKSDGNDQVKVTYGEGFKSDSSGVNQPVIENSKTALTIRKVDGSGEKLDQSYMNQVELTLTDKTDPARTLVLSVPKDGSSADANETDFVTYNRSDESWTITGWLIQGHEYTLRETKRPYEYRTAPEITFKMGEMGVITKVKNAYASTSDTLTVSDKKLVGKITLTKTLKDGNNVSALKDVVFDLYRTTPDGTSVYRENLRTNVSGQIVAENLPEGTYYFVEKEAPGNVYMDGGQTEKVTIDESAADEVNLEKTIAKSDVPFETKVELVKVEENEGNAVIPGTEFTLSKLDKDDNPIPEKNKTQVTGENGKVTFVINEAGKYQIKETKPAYGYENSNYEETFTVTNTSDFQNKTTNLGTVENQRQTGSVKLTKVDKDTGAGLPGITFALFKDGETQPQGTYQTGSNGVLTITGLEWGSYYLKEVQADGYRLDSTLHRFTIGKTYGADYAGIEVDLGTITNEKNLIKIAKAAQDALEGEYLAGAAFILTKPDNSTESWISGSEPRVFRGLSQGTYKLTETKAPAGYVVSAPVTFTVKADGTITDKDSNEIKDNLVVMRDTPNTLTIRKTDDQNRNLSNEALEQLKLKLEDVTTNDALKKISDTTPVTEEQRTAPQELTKDNMTTNGVWTLTGVLSGDHTYTLTETEVPDNYLIADPITFTMGTDGVIRDITGADTTVTDSGKSPDKVTDGRINNLYLADASANELQVRDTEIKATVTITKQDSQLKKADGNPLTLEDIQFRFFRQNGLKPDLSEETTDTLIKNGESEIWTTNADGQIVIENLSEGNYYFREIKAAGYIYNPNKVYHVTVGRDENRKKAVVTYGEGFEQNAVVKNTRNRLTITKVDETGNLLDENAMKTLELTITDVTAKEKLKAANEEPTETQILTAKNQTEAKNWLLEGIFAAGHTYKLEEKAEKRPYGYLLADPITFTMGEDGKIQKVYGAVLRETEAENTEGTENADEQTAAPAGTTNLYTEDSLIVRDVTIKGSLQLNKKGSDKKPLENVSFLLYRMNGTTPDTAADTQIPFSKEKAEYTTNEYGQIKVTDLPEGKYYFVETAAPDDVFMDGAKTKILTIDPATNGQTQEIEKIDTDFTTSVELFKADNFDASAKNGIEGVKFTLYKLEEKNVREETKITDASGNVSFTIKEAGTYRIQETASAYGYKYDKDNAYTADFVIRNTADFQNNVLHLANTAGTSSADKSGTLEKYQLEITNGLTDVGDTWKNTVTNKRLTGSVTVTKKDNTDPANVTGINKVTFELYKVKGKEETKLGTFQTGNIYTRDTNAKSGWSDPEAVKDQPGLLKISGLDWGSYYLKETVADVYQVDSTKRYEFVIGNIKNDEKKSGIDVTLDDIFNAKNKLTITKIDEDGKPLGSVLDQETLNDLELTVKEVLTDKDGKAEEKDVVVLKPAASANGEYSYDSATTTWTLTGKLTQGHTYKLVETGRPEGYVTAQPITFIMGQDGEIQIQGDSAEKTAEPLNQKGTTNLYTDTALAVRDIKLHADICLEKKDEKGKEVQGAVFSLYKLLGEKADPKSDGLIAEGLETDKEGKTPVQTVGEGYYYFVETAAPADKVLNSTPTTPVQVSEEQHDTVVTVSAVNTDFHYSVEITKKDGTDETLLDGVEFTLYEVVEADENAGTEAGGDAANADSENSEKPADADANADPEPTVTENLVKVASGTTGSENNETGKLTFNIAKAGTYEIQETGTIYGYEFNKENPYKYRFTISNTDEYQKAKLSLEVKNTRSTGTVTLTKKDGETEEALNDIIFALYYKAPGTEEYKKVLDTVTGKTYTGKTNESKTVWEENAGKDGEITVDSLPWGDYYMVETKADGYVLKDSEYHFTIGKAQSLTSGLEVNLTAKYGEITNEPNQLLIAKKDTEGNLIGGAELQLTGPKDYKETWTSVQNGAHLLKRLPEGAYTLTETKAPAGYIRSTEEIHFTVAAGGKILDANGKEIKVTEETPVAITMTNTRSRLTITKVDETGKLLNEKAMDTLELTITDVTAKEKLEAANEERTKTQILTAKNQTEAKNWLLEGIFTAGHTYKLEEKAEKRPYGYLLADPITFTMGEDGKIQKVYGAVLRETEAENTEGTENADEQTAAPAGTTNLYTEDSLIVRDVTIKGSLQLNKKGSDKKPLENVSFLLYRMNGTTPDTAADTQIPFSKEKAEYTTNEYGQIKVTNLPEGKYYFVETAAPDHVFMEGGDSDVAVIDQSAHGKTVEVDMVNTDFQAGVELVKTDIDTGTALAGVEFTLYRKEGEAYTEVSRAETGADGKAAFTLSKAGSYKVVETIGAYGYDYDAENPYTAEFTVTNTADFQNTVLTLADSVSESVARKYSVKISGNLSQSTASVTNKKTPVEETGSITVTKYLQLDGMTNGLEIGTADTTFYTALFTDAEGTRRYSDVKALHIQNGTSTSVTFDGLPKGTYYVFETLADGTRIPYQELTADANGNQYYCTGIGTENIAISPQQKEASAELYNWYLDLPDGYYLSGRLEITKNVVKNGKTTETDDTFYAGIFDEAGNLVTVAELLQNGTVTVEVKLGGDDNTQPVTYTVQETDKDGNPLDGTFPYDIEISGSGYISRENPVGKFTITNTVIEEKPEPTETPTPEPTEVPGDGGSGGNSSGGYGSSNVKTGDDTNAQPFILLFFLSGTALLCIGRKRRKSA